MYLAGGSDVYALDENQRDFEQFRKQWSSLGHKFLHFPHAHPVRPEESCDERPVGLI